MTSASRFHVYVYIYEHMFLCICVHEYIHTCMHVYSICTYLVKIISIPWNLGLLIIKWQKLKINYQVFINMWKLSRVLFHKFTFNRKCKVIYLQMVLHMVNWAKLCCSFLVLFSAGTGELLFRRECLIVLLWLFLS